MLPSFMTIITYDKWHMTKIQYKNPRELRGLLCKSGKIQNTLFKKNRGGGGGVRQSRKISDYTVFFLLKASLRPILKKERKPLKDEYCLNKHNIYWSRWSLKAPKYLRDHDHCVL